MLLLVGLIGFIAIPCLAASDPPLYQYQTQTTVDRFDNEATEVPAAQRGTPLAAGGNDRYPTDFVQCATDIQWCDTDEFWCPTDFQFCSTDIQWCNTDYTWCDTDEQWCATDPYWCYTEIQWCDTDPNWCSTEIQWCDTDDQWCATDIQWCDTDKYWCATDVIWCDTDEYWCATDPYWCDTEIPWCMVGAEEQPATLSLGQAYPNPFNPFATIEFSVPETCEARLTVYDVRGNQVQVLADGLVTRGLNQVVFDGSRLPSGLYIYTLQVGDWAQSKKMVLAK